MAEQPTVKIEIFLKPDGRVAIVATPSMKEMMTLEAKGKMTPAHGVAIFALMMVNASERHAALKADGSKPIWTPRPRPGFRGH